MAPAHAVMVGASWANIVPGALDAGLRAVWVNRSGLAAPPSGVPQITALSDLSGVLGLVPAQT